MTITSRFLWCFVFSIFTLGLVHGREFTDAKGRKMVAEQVSHTGDNIELKRGTKIFSVPITTFSEADQKFIKEWIANNPAKMGYRFRLYTDLEENHGGRSTADGAATDDKVKTRPYTYDIVVYNQSKAKLKCVDIRYEIYVNDVVDTQGNRYVALASGQKKADRLQVIPRKLSRKTIAADGKIEFKPTFVIQNYVDRDGGKIDQFANDKVIGVRVRIYKGKQMLTEMSESEDDARFKKVKWAGDEATEETPEFKR